MQYAKAMNMKAPFPEGSLVRLPGIIGTPPGTGPIPVSKALWYRWIEAGRAPKPVNLTERAVAWRADDLNEMIARFSKPK